MKVVLNIAEGLEVLLGIVFILGLPRQIAGVIISPFKADAIGGLSGTCLMIALLTYLFILTRRKLHRLKGNSIHAR